MQISHIVSNGQTTSTNIKAVVQQHVANRTPFTLYVDYNGTSCGYTFNGSKFVTQMEPSVQNLVVHEFKGVFS